MLKKEYDLAILGAGITGLMLSKKLSAVGLRVALIEKNKTVAAGPSTKNEGWLHRGTYHAQSIADRDSGIQVAKRCIYGHEQIRGYAPEAVEDLSSKSYAVTYSTDRAQEITSRWDEAGVAYTQVPSPYLEREVPELNMSHIAHAFLVQDKGIDTRLLYAKLLHEAVLNGTDIFTSAELVFTDQEQISLAQGNQTSDFWASMFIHCSGYGLKSFFAGNFGLDLALRFWKSHLLVVPRLSKDDVFCLDSGETGMMNHGKTSVVGANEDAIQVPQPDFIPIPEKNDNVKKGLKKLYKWEDAGKQLAVACVKVDMPQMSAAARSLNINYGEPLDKHMYVLPGKMTESPYVTDVVTRMIFDRLNGHKDVASRPCDQLQ